MPTLARADGASRAFHASSTVTMSARKPPPPPRIPVAVTAAANTGNDNGSSNKSSSLPPELLSPTVASLAANRTPSPPPSAPEVQLQLWLKVLRRRQSQVRRLASGNLSSLLFQSFVEDIVSDLTSSRYHCQTGDEEDGQQRQQQQQQHTIDLATGLYSSFLITISNKHQTEATAGATATSTTTAATTKISVEQIGNHFLALFYRSVDDRLPYIMRKHGLDSLRRIFQKLDLRLKEFDEINNEKEKTEVGGIRNRSGDDLCNKKRKAGDSCESLSSHGGKKRKNGKSSTVDGNISLQSNPDLARIGLVTAQHQQNDNELSALQRKKKQKKSRPGSTSDSLQIKLTNSAENSNTITEMASPMPVNISEGIVTVQQQQIRKSTNVEKQGNIMDGTLVGNGVYCTMSQGTSDYTMPFNSTDITGRLSEGIQRVPHETTKRGLETTEQVQQGNDRLVSTSERTSSDTAKTVNVNRNFPNQSRSENGTFISSKSATRMENAEMVIEEHHQEAEDLAPDKQQSSVDSNVRECCEIPQNKSTEKAREQHERTTEDVILGDNPRHDTAKHNQKNQPSVRTTISSHIRSEVDHQNQQLAPDSMSMTSERDTIRENLSSGSTQDNQPNLTSSEMSSTGELSTVIQESILVTNAPPSSTRKVPPQSDETNNKGSECPVSDNSRNGTSSKESCPRLPPSHTLPQKLNEGDGRMAHAAVTRAQNIPDKVDATGSSNISRSSPDYHNTRECGLQSDATDKVNATKDACAEVESNLINIGGSQASATSSVASAGSNKTNMRTPKVPYLSEVIDLTDDLDDDSVPYDTSLHLLGSSPSLSPIKHDNDDGESTSIQKAQADSPPASPVPFSILRNPPPLPLPTPTSFSDVRPIVFSADDPISSRSLSRRPKTTVMFNAGYQLDGSGSCLDDTHCIAISERLKTWDPYWKIVEELGRREVSFSGEAGSSHYRSKTTKVGTRTAPCIDPVRIPQCASIYVDLPNDIAISDSAARTSTGKSIPIRQMAWGVKWGKSAHIDKNAQLQTGDRRLLVRSLPLVRSAKDVMSRADCHIWPKGTFLEMKRGSNDRILSSIIVQRAQQSHAPSEWKGMSHPLDLTYFVPSTDLPLELRLCSYEKVEKPSASDRVLLGSYAIQVAICEYVTPDDLYDQLIGNTESDVIIPTTSLRSATKMARQFLLGQTVSVIDSDDEDNEKRTEEDKSLTFSLLCSITKTVIQTPVRGRNCGHLQCFDLRNFLHANASVSGGRWRCAVCEDFVSVRDLVRCGLFQSMIDAVGGKVSASQDRVMFHSDGTWRLLEPKSRSTANRKSEAADEIIELI